MGRFMRRLLGRATVGGQGVWAVVLWGYRWSSTATGPEMLRDVVAGAAAAKVRALRGTLNHLLGDPRRDHRRIPSPHRVPRPYDLRPFRGDFEGTRRIEKVKGWSRCRRRCPSLSL